MAQTVPEVWPESVPFSYWGNTLGNPNEESSFVSDFPMMSIDINPAFLLAYVLGTVMIIIFAWNRFNQRTFEPRSIDQEVISTLAPSELRNRDVLVKAYAIYALCMIAVYTLLTYFGRLVLQLVGDFNVAGLSFDAQNLDFTRPEWPLVISLGIIGLLPMLKPIEFVETALRRWAHQTAGVPTRIREKAALLISHLSDRLEERRALKISVSADALSFTGVDDESFDWGKYVVPHWLVDHVDRKQAILNAFECRDQVAQLIDWFGSERDNWPDYEVRANLLEIERTQLEAAADVLDDFREFLKTDYHKAPDAGEGEERDFTNEQNRIAAYRRRIERRWDLLKSSLDKHRNELSAILAVYFEHDPDFDRVSSAEFRSFLITHSEDFVEESFQEGPTFWIFLSILAAFLVYFIAIKVGFHSFIGTITENTFNTLISSLIYAMSVLMLFWLPCLLALSYRYLSRRRHNWKLGELDRHKAEHLLKVCLISYLGTAAALCLLSMFVGAMLSPDQKSFQKYFLDPDRGALYYSLGLAVIGSIQGLCVTLAVELRRMYGGKATISLIFLGLANLYLVLVYFAYFQHLWRDLPISYSQILGNISQHGQLYVTHIEGLNFILYGLIAFSSCTIFMPARPKGIRDRTSERRRTSMDIRIPGPAE